MQHGLLILKGSSNIDYFWRALLQHVPQSICIGQAKDASLIPLDVTDDTSLQEVVYEFQQRVSIRPHSYVIWGDKPYSVHVPHRSSWIGAWATGVYSQDLPKLVVDSVLRINKENTEGDKKLNYAERVTRYVVPRMRTGPCVTSLLYAGPRPSVLLMTHDTEIHMWVVVVSDVYMLVWSTQSNLMSATLERMESAEKHKIFDKPIHFGTRSVLSIHPVYLVTKFHAFLKQSTEAGKHLFVTQYISKYIERIMVNLDEIDLPMHRELQPQALA